MFDLPPPDPEIEIRAASQGMSKGLRQTDGPQLLIEPELAFGAVVLGAYLKNVSSPTADAETGVSPGLRGAAGGFDLTASATLKLALGDRGGDRRALEFQAAVSRRVGRLTPRFSLTYSPDDLAATGWSLYAQAGAELSLFEGASASAAIARRERAGGPDYTAFNAGASYAIARNFTADLRYYDTAQGRLGAIYAPRVVAALRVHF